MPFDAGAVTGEISLRYDKAVSALKAVQEQTRASMGRMTQFVAKHQAALEKTGKALIAAGVAVGAGLAIAVNKAASFEAEMRNVNAIMRGGEQGFKRFSTEVLALSTKLPVSADDLAQGLYQVVSGGIAAADAMDVLGAAARAGVAGVSNTATAATALIAILNAYGKTGKDAAAISDVLFRTVDLGVVTFEELSGVIGILVSAAAPAKVSLAEVTAALVVMTRQGYDAAMSATALNRVILAFLDPQEEFAKALKSIGIESASAFIQAKGLTGAIEALSQVAAGNPAILAEMGLEARALRAAMALAANDGKLFTEILKEQQGAAGATAKAFAEQSQSFRVQWGLMKSSVNAFLIDVGTVLLPALKTLTARLGEGARKAREWAGDNKELASSLIFLAAKVAAVATAFGGLLLLLPRVVAGIKLVALFLKSLPGKVTITIALVVTGWEVGKALGTWLAEITGPKRLGLEKGIKGRLASLRRALEEVSAEIVPLLWEKELKSATDAQLARIRVLEKRALGLRTMIEKLSAAAAAPAVTAPAPPPAPIIRGEVSEAAAKAAAKLRERLAQEQISISRQFVDSLMQQERGYFEVAAAAERYYLKLAMLEKDAIDRRAAVRDMEAKLEAYRKSLDAEDEKRAEAAKRRLGELRIAEVEASLAAERAAADLAEIGNAVTVVFQRTAEETAAAYELGERTLAQYVQSLRNLAAVAATPLEQMNLRLRIQQVILQAAQEEMERLRREWEKSGKPVADLVAALDGLMARMVRLGSEGAAAVKAVQEKQDSLAVATERVALTWKSLWENAMQGVESAFSTFFQEIAAGHLRLGSLLKGIWQSIVQSISGLLARMVVAWATKMLASRLAMQATDVAVKAQAAATVATAKAAAATAKAMLHAAIVMMLIAYALAKLFARKIRTPRGPETFGELAQEPIEPTYERVPLSSVAAAGASMARLSEAVRAAGALSFPTAPRVPTIFGGEASMVPGQPQIRIEPGAFGPFYLSVKDLDEVGMRRLAEKLWSHVDDVARRRDSGLAVAQGVA